MLILKRCLYMYRPESWKWGLWAQLSPTLSASLNIKCSKHTSNPILATSVHAVCVHVYIPLLAIMIVLEFPPRLSFSSQVSTESLYGTKRPFFLALEELDMSAREKQGGNMLIIICNCQELIK